MKNPKRSTSISSIALLVALFSMTALTAEHTYANSRINFKQAIDLALSANPRMLDSHAKIKAASAGVTEATGHSLPDLNLVANASKSNNPLNVFSYKLSQGVASFNDFGANQYTGANSLGVQPRNLNSPGYYSNYNTGIILNIPLFKGGNDLANIKRTQALLTAAKHGNQTAKNELVFDLLKAYEGWHAAKALEQEAKHVVTTSNAYMRMTQNLFKQSIVIQGDVNLMKAYLRSTETRLNIAKSETLNQLDTFRTLLGEPKSLYTPGRSIFLESDHEGIHTLLNRGIHENPKIQALKSEVYASKAAIQSSESSNWPQLNLQLRHEWNAENLALQKPSNTAMLEMNWKIFSSGAQYGANKHAMANYEQSSAALDEAGNTIKLLILQTKREEQTTLTEVRTNKQNIKDMTLAVKELYLRYGQGSAALGQLLDAQTRLDQARIQLILTKYHLLLARAKLQVLTNHFMTALHYDHHSTFAELNPNENNRKFKI